MSELKKYPLKLKTVYKGAIWGGNRLSSLGMDGNIPHQAEAWQLTVREDGMNEIENGEYAGMTLGDYLGGDIAAFPLLVKYIDAGDKLSIQVHPAKTEMWYIVDCDADSFLIYGQEGDYTEEELRAALSQGTLEDKLTKVHIRPGECYFIPTGLTHAIGGGILIAEIQENSNITYRVYDYDRRQDDGSLRELHTDKAFAVMKKFSEDEIQSIRFSVPFSSPVSLENYSGTLSLLASCDKFTTRKLDFSGSVTLDASQRFSHIMCVGGEGMISGEPIKAGDSYFVPAGSGEFTIEASAHITVLQSFVI